MSNVEKINNDRELVLQCANMLGLIICEVKSQKEKVVLKDSGNVFNPIDNVNDWGVLIKAMVESGFDFALDHDGIIAQTHEGMLTFNDKNIGRRLTKAFVKLYSQENTKKDIYYVNN